MRFPATLTILLCFLLSASAAVPSPARAAEVSGRPVWSSTELREMEQALCAGGLDIREFAEQSGTRDSGRRLQVHFGKTAARENFAALARLTRGKALPMLSFTVSYSRAYEDIWDVLPDLARLECSYLGLELPFAPEGANLEPLRAVPSLKRLSIPYDNLKMLPELPQVNELIIRSEPDYLRFTPDLILARFPNLEALTLPPAFPCHGFSSDRFPASLAEVTIHSASKSGEVDYRDVLGACLQAAARKIPTVRLINGVSADNLDPLAKLTPEQHKQYTVLQSYVRTELEFTARAPSLRGAQVQDMPLRGRIAVYSAGSYQETAYKGENQDLRRALIADPDACDTLVILTTRFHRIWPKRRILIGGSDYTASMALYVLDRKKGEMALVWNRYIGPREQLPDPWQRIEELFALGQRQ